MTSVSLELAPFYPKSNPLPTEALHSALSKVRTLHSKKKVNPDIVLTIFFYLEILHVGITLKKRNYSKTFVEQQLKNRQNSDLNDKW